MNDLVVLENIDAIAVFSEGGVDDLLKKITDEAKSIVADVETARGRKDITAMAHKVAKSKTFLDALGKDLVSDWKTKSKAVDNERKKMRDTLDTLKEEVRKPLTDWENTEKERVEKHETNIKEIESIGSDALNNWIDENLYSMLKYVESFVVGDFEEYANDAAKAKDKAINQTKEAIVKREKYDAEQVELAELRTKTEEQAKSDAIAVKAAVDLELVQVAQRERDRIEDERIAQEAAAKKREADKKHRGKINTAAEADLVAIGVVGRVAKKVIAAIAKGQISHIRISY